MRLGMSRKSDSQELENRRMVTLLQNCTEPQNTVSRSIFILTDVEISTAWKPAGKCLRFRI